LFAAFLALIGGCSDSSAPPANAPTAIGAAVPKSAPKDAQTAPIPRAPAEVPQGSGFDFYVLALSWSPAYCALKGSQGDPAQCGASKPFRFIVHGLWPQNERGLPDQCDASTYPTRDEIRSVTDLTPSPGLVRHEWEKHGACSGLSPANYFWVMRAAADHVVIPAPFSGAQAFSLSPPSIETGFIRANPGLAASGIATVCDSGLLTEVRICLTKSLEFRACPDVDRRGCRAGSIKIQPVQ
jgi:ribonuclease T2